MRIFGLEIGRASEKALTPVPERGGWRTIFEPFTGAWQRNMEERHGTILCYPTLYACLNRISQDIGKLPFLLKIEDENGIWKTIENPAYSPVLRKPNNYQTAQQFRESWILSKLIHGNAYILKGRDARGVVVRLYVLDPCRVMPLVSDSGDIYYQINYPTAENLLPANYPGEQMTIPAREIIHDRLNTFHHHLIGVPPLCAAHYPALKNFKILKNSTEFFANAAQPGGILTAPAGMSDTDAQAVKAFWDTNYGGDNRGKIAVLGADMKFTSFAFNSADSQLVEQMQYSDRQICQPFGIPPYIVGVGEIPAGLKVDDVTNTYYSLALQAHIEAMEYLLDEGLGVARPMGVELDLRPLLRMDMAKQAEVVTKLIGGMAITPDEGRSELGYGPTPGGDTIWAQQQDFPLGTLRDRLPPDQKPEPPPAPANDGDAEQLEAANEEVRSLRAYRNTQKAIEAMRNGVLQ